MIKKYGGEGWEHNIQFLREAPYTGMHNIESLKNEMKIIANNFPCIEEKYSKETIEGYEKYIDINFFPKPNLCIRCGEDLQQVGFSEVGNYTQYMCLNEECPDYEKGTGYTWSRHGTLYVRKNKKYPNQKDYLYEFYEEGFSVNMVHDVSIVVEKIRKILLKLANKQIKYNKDKLERLT